MKTPSIQITQKDYNKLRSLLHDHTSRSENKECYEALDQELNRAKIKSPEDIPSDVITLYSKVRLLDLSENEFLELTLVLPDKAHADDGFISVLAPLGTAILGYRKGDIFSWNTPGGQSMFRVEDVLFQPEANHQSLLEKSLA